MKTLNKIFLILAVIAFVSCDDHLTELNVNPNGVDPSVVNPNLIMPTIIVGIADHYLDDNYQGDQAGVMQYIQKSGWGAGGYDYEWTTAKGWSGRYNVLRNANHLISRSEQMGMEFHQGVGYVVRAWTFGYIADSWGPAPYTYALNATGGDQTDYFPPYDDEETIYRGIIEELKNANTLLSKPRGQYEGISASADVLYNGDPALWRKFANSLMLRYYMRLSDKLPTFAQNGIEEIMGNPSQFPIFTSNSDEAAMNYVGASRENSWPVSVAFDASRSGFERIQMCAGIRDALQEHNDPRMAVWFNPVRVQIQVSEDYPEGDVVVDGVRYLRPDHMAANNMVVYNPDTWVDDAIANRVIVDTNVFVGAPIAYTRGDIANWNLNPAPIQGGANPHNSALADMFQGPAGELLQARLITYAEVSFILAEAAQKGWNVGGGTQQQWYENGIQASLDYWQVGGQYDDYIAEPGVAYDGSLEQIMEQKWIANFNVAHESWLDWRRTGLPDLTVGPNGARQAMPLRFQYPTDEISRNFQNWQAASSTLVQTAFTAGDGDDSAWSRVWLIQ